MEGDLLRLGRPPTFEGSEEAWQEWAFQARAFLSLLGDSVADDLIRVETAREKIEVDDLNEVRRGSARKVYYVLTMLLRGPPLAVLRQVEDSNGYEAWRQLTKRYDSNLAGRQHNLLSMILRPKQFPTEALAWEDALMQWKREVRRWEQITNDFLPDSVQCTVLLENAPSHIRAQLALQGHTTSEALEMAIMSYLGVQRFLQQSGGGGTSTMEVDAVTRDGKSKPKGKDKGKQKGAKPSVLACILVVV